MKPHRGVLILVFGILSLVLCQFFGIAAWTMGNTDLHEIAMGRMDPSGADLTKVGRICGMVGTGILILQVVVMSLFGLAMLLAPR